MAPAAAAWAEWVELGKSESATVYYDPATIETQDNIVHVLELQDLNRPFVPSEETAGASSGQYLTEYDCRNMRYRMLSVTAFSGPMASGKILGSGNVRDGSIRDEWHDISPGGSGAAMLKVICK